MRTVFFTSVLFFSASPVFALQPPTAGQLTEYRKEGTLSEKIAAASSLGNDKFSNNLIPKANYKLRRMSLQSKGLSSSQIDKIAPAPPPAWQGMPTTGNVKIFTLLIDFSDYAAEYSSNTIDSIVFGNGSAPPPGDSLRNYYARSSYNLLDISGATLGWYHAGARSSVPQTAAGREALIKDALNYFSGQGHDFSQYDNNGDGKLDYFAVMWTGPYGAWASFWWGYQTSFSDQAYTISGKRLGEYSWQKESNSPTTVIHETGHALGVPDYYDYDGASGPDGGLGGLDIMDGNLGDHNSFSKFMLDWLTPDNFETSTHTVVLRPSNGYGDGVKLFPGGAPGNLFDEFFMVQNRVRDGNDLDIPADGLLIWHVDARLNGAGTDFQYNNSYTGHKLLRLMEADGLEEIEQGQGADAGDFFAEGDFFGPGTVPDSKKHDGSGSGVFVNGISSTVVSRSFNCGISPQHLSPSFSQVYFSSLTVEWSSLPGSDYVAVLAADNGYSQIVSSVTQGVNSAAYTALQPGRPYFFQVKPSGHSDEAYLSNRISTATYPGAWSVANSMYAGRYSHSMTLLPNGTVLVAGGYNGLYLSSAEIYDPAADTWTGAAAMSSARRQSVAVLLSDGKVLVTGGSDAAGSYIPSAEIYDPDTGTWADAATMSTARYVQTATLLPNGKVLVTGGYNGSYLSSAELYDPRTNTWTSAGSMSVARYSHTATLLPNGKVLIAGGRYSSGYYASAELYDPETNSWSSAGTMSAQRYTHTAIRLPDGRVLVAGGRNASTLAGAEIYDPTGNSWTSAGSMSAARYAHAAVLLPNGRVIVSGGEGQLSAEIYAPDTNTWLNAGVLTTAHSLAAATLLPNGKVLLTGGNGVYLSAVELFSAADTVITGLQPAFTQVDFSSITITWTQVQGAEYTVVISSDAVFMHQVSSATQSGNSAVFMGLQTGTPYFFQVKISTETEWSYVGNRISTTTHMLAALSWTGEAGYLSDGLSPDTDTSTKTYIYRIKYANAFNLSPAAGYPRVHIKKGGAEIPGSPFTMQYISGNYDTGAIYAHPNVLSPGTDYSYRFEAQDSEGNYATGLPTEEVDAPDVYFGAWANTAAMGSTRYSHTATLLPDGRVLVAGGDMGNYTVNSHLSSVEIYEPDADSWVSVSSMSSTHMYHTATLLPNGKVLIAGDFSSAPPEVFDPYANSWARAGSVAVGRSHHTATLLPNGKVLVAGGNSYSRLAELYDPDSNSWTGAGTISVGRRMHTATLLPNGKVLLVGGYGSTDGGNDSILSTTDIYDPVTESWENGPSMSSARYNHTSTLLPDGKVLIAGGDHNFIVPASPEIYNPDTNSWESAPSMSPARFEHTATQLPDGKVFVAGGRGPDYVALSSGEVFDPQAGEWLPINAMPGVRVSYTSTLLPSGQVLVAGGSSSSAALLFSSEQALTRLSPVFSQVSFSSVTVTWAQIPGANYTVAFSTDVSFMRPISSVNQSGNSVAFTGLSTLTRYFFEVKLSTEVEWAYAGNKISTITLTPASLSWTGEPNYASGGLYPEVGSSTMTFFYRIKYVNSNNTAPAVGYPRVHIVKGGTDIAGSPFSMAYVSGSYDAGAIYEYQRLFDIGKDYSYSIEARDADGNQAAEPAILPVDAPDVNFADMYEPDGASASAKTIIAGIPQYRSIYPANETDWIKFTLPAVSSVTIVISPHPGWLYLYSSNSGPIAMNGFGTSPYTYNPATLPAGTYYLKVNYPQEVPVYELALSAAGLLHPGFPQVFVTSATVAWDTVAGAEYTAVFSSNTAFTSIISSATGLESTKTYTGLFPGTTYYFKVKLSNEADASYAVNNGSFTVLPDVTAPEGMPGTPSAGGPYAVVSTVTFTWDVGTSTDPESGIAGYYLQIGTDTVFDDSSVFNSEVGNVQMKQVQGLAEGRTYFARVKPKNGVGVYGNYSPWSSGTTIDLSSPTAVPALNDGTGPDIMYSTSAHILYANWGAAADPQSGIARYWYAIGTTPGGTEIRAWTENGVALSTAAGGLDLAEGIRHYFAVKAENGAAMLSPAAVSDGQIVDTLPPASLGFGSITSLSANAIITTGTAVDTNSGLASLPYYIQLSTDGASWGSYNSGWVASSYNWQDLASNATAWFRLKAKDTAGNDSAYSDVVSAITFPIQPELSGSGAYTDVQENFLTVNWSSGSAAAGYNTPEIAYEVELSTAAGFSPVADSSTTYGLNSGFSGLAANTTYYVRVRSEGYGDPGPFTDLGWTVTSAYSPAGSGFLNVWRSSAVVDWSANGNPPGTFYQTEFWATGASTTSLTVNTDSAVISGLRQETTFYARVRTVNFNGVPTGYDLTVSTYIPATLAALTLDEDRTLFYDEISLTVPANTFTEGAVVFMKRPESVPPESEELKSLPNVVAVDISALAAGLQKLQPLKDVEITVDYRDIAIGGTAEDALVIATYSENRAVWVPLYTTRDRLAKTVTARTGHFSLFQLMYSVSGSGVSGITVGPNPLRPARYPGQQFTFRHLPAGASVRIYTYLGELLFETTADTAGMAVWDGRNKAGRLVASDVYLALIRSGGKKKLIKLVVEK